MEGTGAAAGPAPLPPPPPPPPPPPGPPVSPEEPGRLLRLVPARTRAALEAVWVRFGPEEWASLAGWQRRLHWQVMEETLELVASLVDAGSMPPQPELLCGTEPMDGSEAQDPLHSQAPEPQGTPGPANQDGGDIQEVKIKEEPEVHGSPPCSPPAWGPPGPNSYPLALCPSWCEVKLMDVRSLSTGALVGGARAPVWEEVLICGECGNSFADADSLAEHRQALHEVAEPDSDKAEGQAESKGPFVCPSCGKAFCYHRNLLTHKKHRGKRRHGCVQCGAHFCLRGDLLRHRASHVAESVFPCSVCSLVFRHKKRLAAHTAEEHPQADAAGVGCPECHRVFAAESELLRHQEAEHKGGQPFACPTCGERFSWRESLHIHQRKHGPERAFSCHLCGKSFSRQGNLLTHQRVHTGELPFACPDCQRVFPTKASLVAHGRLHRRKKPFPCPRCSRCFRLQEKLLEHQASHGPQEIKEGPQP